MEKIPPAYYATNLGALSFGEMMRIGGFFNGLLGFALGRFMPPQGREPMPPDYDVMEAQRSDIAPHILGRICQKGDVLLPLGFREVGYQRLPHKADKSGSIIYLSNCGQMVAHISVLKKDEPANDYGVAPSVCAFDTQANTITVSNSGLSVNPLPGSKLIIKKGKRLNQLVPILKKEMEISRREYARFAGWQDLREWQGTIETRTFLHRRDVRKLFVPVD
ncbi:hypothetical protein [Cerasicoccus maritimus]|uniref:hypothetical protein n=1 Tax=Cerasicoccus maritimus TaxID=490089 RepID=UPI002852A07E|nr:hypothetical protein [Cerasicoccus maritimus]